MLKHVIIFKYFVFSIVIKLNREPNKKILIRFFNYSNFPLFQCLRYTTFSKSRAQASKPFPIDVLRSCYLFYSRLWRFCTRYLAFSTLYGDNDLCSTHSSTNSG